MPRLFRAVEIGGEGSSAGPVQYVGTYVLRWPSCERPQFGFVEVRFPRLDRINALVSEVRMILQMGDCPRCFSSGLERMTNHQSGKCELHNRYKDAMDNLAVLERFALGKGE